MYWRDGGYIFEHEMCSGVFLYFINLYLLAYRKGSNMFERWNVIIDFTHQRMVSGNIIFGMFFLSIVCICVLGKDKKISRMLGLYSAIAMLLIYFPPMVYFIERYWLDNREFYKMFWLFPVIVAIPYLLVFWEGTIEKRKYKMLFLAGTTIFFVIRGSMAYSLAEESDNKYRLPTIVMEIANVMSEDAYFNDIERIQAVVATEIRPYIRQYDASIAILSDTSFSIQNERNLYINENNQELLERIHFLNIEAASLSRLMEIEGYNYLVLWKYTFNLNVLGKEFEEVDEVSEYVIFRRNNTEQRVSVFNDVDYFLVFDYYFYLDRYEDIKKTVGTEPVKVLEHFITVGMYEGRMGRASFSPEWYKQNYPDLAEAFGYNWKDYYIHYMMHGYFERRNAARLIPIVDGVNFTPIFDFYFFKNRYPNLVKEMKTLDEILAFFVEEGMKKGLQGTRRFDVFYYKENNPDLVTKFGDYLELYYIHFLDEGRHERRAPAFSSPFLELRAR